VPAAPRGDSYGLALHWLSLRELSVTQVRQRLARRGFPAETVDGTIARLLQVGALDESRMARAAARLETAIKGRGPARARRKLRSLGLSEALAEQALDAAYQEVDVATLLDRALEKRLRRAPAGPLDHAAVRRVLGSLVRQGFAPGAVLARLRARGAKADVDVDVD
jgi:regulatory protein